MSLIRTSRLKTAKLSQQTQPLNLQKIEKKRARELRENNEVSSQNNSTKFDRIGSFIGSGMISGSVQSHISSKNKSKKVQNVRKDSLASSSSQKNKQSIVPKLSSKIELYKDDNTSSSFGSKLSVNSGALSQNGPLKGSF